MEMGFVMFVLEYCCDPENRKLHPTFQSYDNSIEEEFEKKIQSLDKFEYLINMFLIIESCTIDLVNVSITTTDEFWRINKVLLNYVNAVYSYKEFINGSFPSLKIITEDYYENKKWYRFICDYRNRVIHQSTVIKDYNPGSNDIYVNLDEMIEVQKSLIFEKGIKRKSGEKFIAVLSSMKDEADLIDGKNYISMKYIATKAEDEIIAMRDKVLMYAYKEEIKGILEWLISFMPIVNGVHQYVYIVDKKRLPDAVYEPNFTLEDYVSHVIVSLGVDHIIFKEIVKLLKNNKYDYFYDGYCNFSDFILRKTRA